MLGQESKKSQEGGAREERRWEDLYSNLNTLSLLSLEVKTYQPLEGLSFITNDWSSRLQALVSEISIHGAHPAPMSSPLANTSVKDREVFVFRPRNSYIRSYRQAQVPAGGELFISERELDHQAAEYDMDEHDFFWLRMVNQERLSKGLKRITENDFERLMEFFESSWFEYSRPSQRWNSRKLESKCAEDLRCDICGVGDTAAANNLIVLCEFCDVAVHQECYGVPLIPEGPWLCRKCYLMGSKMADCAFCPWKSGALKPTTDSSKPWCHVVCALGLEGEIRFLNSTLKEPIEISRVHPERWNLVCNLCKVKAGAPVQCSIKSCHAAMHPKCARSVSCSYDMQTCTFKCLRHSDPGNLDILPTLVTDLHKKMLKIDGKEGRKLFHEPTLPQIVLSSARPFIRDLPDRMRPTVVESVAKYWSLKRGRRHGVPLIRSLQIEPWTSGGVLSNISLSLHMRRELLEELKRLETVVALLYQLERRKLGSLLLLSDIIHLACHPFQTMLLVICNFLRYLCQNSFESLTPCRKLDRHQFFAAPVNPTLVPDYYEIVKKPMDLDTLQRNILTSCYRDFESFYEAVLLITHNAMTYNSPETMYFTDAVKFREEAIPVMKLAENFLLKNRIFHPDDTWPLAFRKLGTVNGLSDIEEKSEQANWEMEMLGAPSGMVWWAKKEGLGYVPARPVDTSSLTPVEKRTIPRQALQAAVEDPQGKYLVQFFGMDNIYQAVRKETIFRSKNNVFADDCKKLLIREGRKKGALGDKQALRHAYNDALVYFTGVP